MEFPFPLFKQPDPYAENGNGTPLSEPRPMTRFPKFELLLANCLDKPLRGPHLHLRTRIRLQGFQTGALFI